MAHFFDLPALPWTPVFSVQKISQVSRYYHAYPAGHWFGIFIGYQYFAICLAKDSQVAIFREDSADAHEVYRRTYLKSAYITIAALFLQEFVPENTPWVHLDIAGPAYVEKANEYTQRGGTGYGVRTLIRFLLQLDQLRL